MQTMKILILITEINVDYFEEDTTQENLLDFKDLTRKKRGLMDFIGPQVKLSVEKLAHTFISSPNLSSPEIEDVF